MSNCSALGRTAPFSRVEICVRLLRPTKNASSLWVNPHFLRSLRRYVTMIDGIKLTACGRLDRRLHAHTQYRANRTSAEGPRTSLLMTFPTERWGRGEGHEDHWRQLPGATGSVCPHQYPQGSPLVPISGDE